MLSNVEQQEVWSRFSQGAKEWNTLVLSNVERQEVWSRLSQGAKEWTSHAHTTTRLARHSSSPISHLPGVKVPQAQRRVCGCADELLCFCRQYYQQLSHPCPRHACREIAPRLGRFLPRHELRDTGQPVNAQACQGLGRLSTDSSMETTCKAGWSGGVALTVRSRTRETDVGYGLLVARQQMALPGGVHLPDVENPANDWKDSISPTLCPLHKGFAGHRCPANAPLHPGKSTRRPFQSSCLIWNLQPNPPVHLLPSVPCSTSPTSPAPSPPTLSAPFHLSRLRT